MCLFIQKVDLLQEMGYQVCEVTWLCAGWSTIWIPTVVGVPFVENVQMGCGVHPAFYLIGVKVPPWGKGAEIWILPLTWK